jgi:membrane protease YdiL (CAAX protease family)
MHLVLGSHCFCYVQGLPSSILRPAIQTAVFLLLYIISVYLAIPLFDWTGGYLVGLTVGSLVASVFANSVALAIFDSGKLTDVGFPWNRDSVRNGAIGLVGGIAAALTVLCVPLLTGLAQFVPAAPDPNASWRSLVFFPVLLICGSMGEELLFHGFGFQVLLKRFGKFTTILPTGVLFGLLHASNPNASKLGIANTMAFGVLFGFAFLRSHDLWLPIGLHFGWNFTLPMFGVNLSGITIKPTGWEILWKAGPLWSGGEYGPEASVLTSVVLILLAIYLWKAPIAQQYAPVYDAPSLPESPQPL